MLELRSRCRGQNRGGWDLGGTEGPATAACASGLLTGQQCSLSRASSASPQPPHLLEQASWLLSQTGRVQHHGCTLPSTGHMEQCGPLGPAPKTPSEGPSLAEGWLSSSRPASLTHSSRRLAPGGEAQLPPEDTDALFWTCCCSVS